MEEKRNPLRNKSDQFFLRFFQGMFLCCVILIGVYLGERCAESKNSATEQKDLIMIKQEAIVNYQLPVAGIERVLDQKDFEYPTVTTPIMLEEYQSLYEENSDLIGWLKIPDTIIDYPVMQTMEDEDYYLDTDFYGQKNKNGCLILDTDSRAGAGISENDYAGGCAPTTNLIIHGHTMKSGQMFGDLNLYKEEAYGKDHKVICFDSLYEKREYEVMAVFYSQVFYKDQDVFKYYKFFQANTSEEFQYWYDNVMSMSLYDTGVTAEFGDEFLTLSCCSYQVEDGRFVVVGKRIK